MFKANVFSSSPIKQQYDLLPDVRELESLAWSPAAMLELSDNHRDWLSHSASLTARLTRHTDKLLVKLLTPGWVAEGDGASAPLMRQVLLMAGETPWIWGLTQVDAGQLHQEPILLNWKSQPLGLLLFAEEPHDQRQFELADFAHCSAFALKLQQWQCPQPHSSLWGRRSTLQFHSCRLTLTEVFLPQHPMYGV